MRQTVTKKILILFDLMELTQNQIIEAVRLQILQYCNTVEYSRDIHENRILIIERV